MNLFLTFLFIIFVSFFGLVPFFLLYLFSDLLYLLLYYVFGYRKKVVYENLSQAFPGLEKRELGRLNRLSYKNLSDIIVEGLKGFTMTRRQILKRHKIINPEIVKPFDDAGKSIIVVSAHYGNWEWGSLSPGLQFGGYDIVAFYKPMSNRYINRFMKKNRARTGTILASIYKTAESFETQKEKPTVFIMAADQSPSNSKKAYWVDFLGRETAFLHGPERHARNNNIPVVYVDIQRVKRGYYELELTVLADNPSHLKDGEITQRYASKLESVIRKQPGNWLWSHKRWKLSR